MQIFAPQKSNFFPPKNQILFTEKFNFFSPKNSIYTPQKFEFFRQKNQNFSPTNPWKKLIFSWKFLSKFDFSPGNFDAKKGEKSPKKFKIFPLKNQIFQLLELFKGNFFAGRGKPKENPSKNENLEPFFHKKMEKNSNFWAKIRNFGFFYFFWWIWIFPFFSPDFYFWDNPLKKKNYGKLKNFGAAVNY